MSVFTSLSCWQIVCSLEQDDAARKQRLAFKLEQVVAFMSLESWGPHFPGRTGKKPRQKPSRAWAKTCPHPFHHVTSSRRLSKMTSSLTFFLLPLPQEIILFSSSTLLHRLVYLNISEGWFRAEVGISHSAMWGIPQLHHRESFKGWFLEAGHIGMRQSPCWKKRGEKHFYVAFKNLHW